MESNIEVTDVPDEGRFRVTVDGIDAGGAYYRRLDRAVVFTHTEVDDAYSGQGVGSRLARAALDAVRERGEVAVPLCPFIAAYVQRHDEYSDLVDEELTARLRHQGESR